MATLVELEKEIAGMKQGNAHMEAEIAHIKERNRKVEADKAWETSWQRKVAIVALTYAVTSIVFASIGVPKPFENALVPTTAFLLSTLTLEAFKGMWLRNRGGKQ